MNRRAGKTRSSDADSEEARRGAFVRVVNSPRSLALLGMSVVTIGALAYGLAEHTSWLNALYWAFVTATTLGYGDFAPHTTAGKVTSVALVGFTVVFFIPMITASIASRLIVDRDVFTHEEQEEIKELLRAIHTKVT